MRIVIAGGGTAGHVFPAVALGQELAARGHELVFVGTDRGLERTLVPAAGFRLETVAAKPFLRKASMESAKAPLALFSAAKACRVFVEGAAVVVGMGGYASAPALIAARRANRPIILHEQNAVPGAANRMFASQARVVAVSFEDARDAFGRAQDIRLTGNPVRSQIAAATLDHGAVRATALARFGFDADAPVVVVAGGSQGALHLNQVVVDAVPVLVEAGAQVLILAGEAHASSIEAACANADGVVVLPFLPEMELAYACADLLLCRSGATTIAELTLSGVASVLVPYPHATGNHQEANARELERVGASDVLLDHDLEAGRLASTLLELLADRTARSAMATAARAWARPDAAKDLSDIVEASA